MTRLLKCRHEVSSQDADWVKRVFRATGIKTCSYFLPKERLFEKMSRVQYVEYVRSGLFKLGMEAAQKAIKDWGGSVQDITHIVWVNTLSDSVVSPIISREQQCRECRKHHCVDA